MHMSITRIYRLFIENLLHKTTTNLIWIYMNTHIRIRHQPSHIFKWYFYIFKTDLFWIKLQQSFHRLIVNTYQIWNPTSHQPSSLQPLYTFGKSNLIFTRLYSNMGYHSRLPSRIFARIWDILWSCHVNKCIVNNKF